MSPKKNPSLPKAWETKDLIVESLPSHSTQVRQLVIIISTAVGLTLGSVGGYAWYISQKNQEEGARVLLAKKRALAALKDEEKKPKELTKAEKEFAQKSKKLTVNEDGEIGIYTPFSKTKDTDIWTDAEMREVSTDKEKPAHKPAEPVPVQMTTQVQELPEVKTPPPKIVREDGSIVLTGRPGEAEELSKILRHVFANDARKKSNP